MDVQESLKNLELLLPKLQEYEKNFQLETEEEALKETKRFYAIAYALHLHLIDQESKEYPELLYLFNHYAQFNIHAYDQSTRTPGDSTWTLTPSWTLLIDTSVGTFGVYTLGRAMVAEFKTMSNGGPLPPNQALKKSP